MDVAAVPHRRGTRQPWARARNATRLQKTSRAEGNSAARAVPIIAARRSSTFGGESATLRRRSPGSGTRWCSSIRPPRAWPR